MTVILHRSRARLILYSCHTKKYDCHTNLYDNNTAKGKYLYNPTSGQMIA